MTHRPRSMFARWARRLAGAATLVLVAGTTTVLAPGPRRRRRRLRRDLHHQRLDSGGGFTANITIKNLGDPLTAWTLGLRPSRPPPSELTQGWSANWSQSGSEVTATNMPWNGNLATGASHQHRLQRHLDRQQPQADRRSPSTAPPAAARRQPAADRRADLAGRRRAFTAPPPCRSPRPPPTRTAPIGKVEFYQRHQLLGTDTTAPYAYSWQNVPAGSYSITAKAYDNARRDHRPRPGRRSPSRADTTPGAGGQPADAGRHRGRHRAPSASSCRGAPTGERDRHHRPDQRRHRPHRLRRRHADLHPGELEHRAERHDRRGRGRRHRPAAPPTFTVDRHRLRLGRRSTATEVDDDTPAATTRTSPVHSTLYNKIKDPANGYFSPEGVPYHSVETLMVEAPDHGHETTSEAFSY